MSMTPEQVEAWGKTRADGRLRYVLRSGVLAWGVPMFVVMTFIANRDRNDPVVIAISAVMWLLGGAAFGAIMWTVSERQYRKAMPLDGA